MVVILLTSVERDNDELGTLGAALVVDGLVVVYGGAAVATGSDHTGGTTCQKTLEDLYTNTALSNTGQESGLLGKGRSVCRNIRQHIKVNVCEFLRVSPVCTCLALEVEEGQV